MLWPGLLGKTKYEFAKTYCDLKYIKGIQGKFFADYSKGVRLEELNVLLKQTVMVVSHTHINHLMSTSTFHIFFLDIINYFSRSILQFWHQLFKWLAWHFEAMRAVLLWNLCSQIGLFDECILIVFSFYLANPT